MIRINLLPWREEKRKMQQKIYGYLIFLLMIFVSLLYMAMHFYLQRLIQHLENTNRYLQAQLIHHQDEIEKIKSLERRCQLLLNANQRIAPFRYSQDFLILLLDHLFAHVPKEIVLQKIAMNNAKVQLQGQTLSMVALSEWIHYFPKARLVQIAHPLNATVFNFLIEANQVEDNSITNAK
jgi:type IV pilus assembly protein PilN